MSKQVKDLIMRDYESRISTEEGYPDATLISIRGLKGQETTRLREGLRKKNIRITVIRNNLAQQKFKGTNLDPFNTLLTGSNALAYGGNSVVEVARELVDLIGKFPALELRGAVLDGELFEGKKGVEELSKFPTREEAIGRVVTLIVSPAGKLVSQLQGPGAGIAGLIKAIEEKLEKGEAIAKTA